MKILRLLAGAALLSVLLAGCLEEPPFEATYELEMYELTNMFGSLYDIKNATLTIENVTTATFVINEISVNEVVFPYPNDGPLQARQGLAYLYDPLFLSRPDVVVIKTNEGTFEVPVKVSSWPDPTLRGRILEQFRIFGQKGASSKTSKENPIYFAGRYESSGALREYKPQGKSVAPISPVAPVAPVSPVSDPTPPPTPAPTPTPVPTPAPTPNQQQKSDEPLILPRARDPMTARDSIESLTEFQIHVQKLFVRNDIKSLGEYFAATVKFNGVDLSKTSLIRILTDYAASKDNFSREFRRGSIIEISANPKTFHFYLTAKESYSDSEGPVAILVSFKYDFINTPDGYLITSIKYENL